MQARPDIESINRKPLTRNLWGRGELPVLVDNTSKEESGHYSASSEAELHRISSEMFDRLSDSPKVFSSKLLKFRDIHSESGITVVLECARRLWHQILDFVKYELDFIIYQYAGATFSTCGCSPNDTTSNCSASSSCLSDAGAQGRVSRPNWQSKGHRESHKRKRSLLFVVGQRSRPRKENPRLLACPVKKHQEIHGLSPSCSFEGAENMNTVKRHLERLPHKNYIPFLRACPNCWEYVVDSTEWGDIHRHRICTPATQARGIQMNAVWLGLYKRLHPRSILTPVDAYADNNDYSEETSTNEHNSVQPTASAISDSRTRRSTFGQIIPDPDPNPTFYNQFDVLSPGIDPDTGEYPRPRPRSRNPVMPYDVPPNEPIHGYNARTPFFHNYVHQRQIQEPYMSNFIPGELYDWENVFDEGVSQEEVPLGISHPEPTLMLHCPAHTFESLNTVPVSSSSTINRMSRNQEDDESSFVEFLNSSQAK